MCKIKLNYNNPEFNQTFTYSENSASGLWRDNNVLAGSIRTTKETPLIQAWFVKHKSVAYAVHRIVWYLHHGYISDELIVDHIDGNPLNNKINNLRLVSQEVNNKNHAKQKNNKTGITGVYYEKSSKRYRVTWSSNSEKYQKSFSCTKYGDELALELATAFRMKILSELGDYSERHGT